MSPIDINGLLQQMRSLHTQMDAVRADTPVAGSDAIQGLPGTDPASGHFGQLLEQSIQDVNRAQQHAGQLQNAFERGDPDTGLAQVMVSMQKADLSFRTMVEVRNKLVDAYKDVMNMQV